MTGPLSFIENPRLRDSPGHVSSLGLVKDPVKPESVKSEKKKESSMLLRLTDCPRPRVAATALVPTRRCTAHILKSHSVGVQVEPKSPNCEKITRQHHLAGRLMATSQMHSMLCTFAHTKKLRRDSLTSPPAAFNKKSKVDTRKRRTTPQQAFRQLSRLRSQ